MISHGIPGLLVLLFLHTSLLTAQHLAAFDDYLGLERNESKYVDVLINDIKPLGAVLSILDYTNTTQMSSPPKIHNGREIEITSPGLTGQDKIMYSICADFRCDTAALHVKVHEVNSVNGVNDVYVISALGTTILEVLKNDVGANAANLQLLTAPHHGSASVQGSKVLYTPSNLSFRADSMDYRICRGNTCSSASIFIYNYNPKPPVINDVFVEIPENTDYSFPLSDFAKAFTDPEGGFLAGIKISGLPENGVLSFADNSLSKDTYIKSSEVKQLIYTPHADYSGADSFEWKAIAGTRVSNAAYVKIKLTPVLADLRIYEGFSPNGDQVNDQWIIEGIHDYPENQIKIFNRFGMLVFRLNNYDNRSRVWSGETNVNHFNPERTAPDDIYYFTISIPNRKSLNGSIVLKR